MSFHGHVEKGLVVLDRPLPLPDGTPVLVEPIAAAPMDFWQSCDLEELARRQGVSLPAAVDELFGGWPPEEKDDDFEGVFRSWREQEWEKRP